MAQDLFNVPIFFIVLRETVEAAIIVSVLLSFVEQLMLTGRLSSSSAPSKNGGETNDLLDDSTTSARPAALAQPGSSSSSRQHAVGHENESADDEETSRRVQRLVRRMRIQIWAGAIIGFVIALAIGAAFIAVFYTKLVNLWAETEQIWEGAFCIIASLIIFVMGIAFLRMDRARVKWRVKLATAFEDSHSKAIAHHRAKNGTLRGAEGRGQKWALFLLPFITVLREGLEAVVFVGGISLSTSAKAIPILVIVGLIAGGTVGYIIYRTGATTTLHWFLVASTSFLFLIGAGLASKGIGFFQYYYFSKGVGRDVAERGDRPGSFQVKGNVWHLTYGNPEVGSQTTNVRQIFNAIFGWNNTATLGTKLIYVFYWLAMAVTLVYRKWKEGRASCLGRHSKIGNARAVRRGESR
ncbi:high-affinity iron permease [Saitozyma podzolica]|uniref:High-affinity iron permease n=1 Tax=Saitozyma podzolica TaxID=1890683 RepID=A0A427XMX8_9TREE|nr:high-affinity iron permease [Saitozyma podzolica]